MIEIRCDENSQTLYATEDDDLSVLFANSYKGRVQYVCRSPKSGFIISIDREPDEIALDSSGGLWIGHGCFSKDVVWKSSKVGSA